jgi:hypothetical protein
MEYTILEIKQKVMVLIAIDVDTWWNLIHDILIANLEEIFSKHKVDEDLYRRKLRAY